MKSLPLKFVKKGFKHTQIKREGDVALYKRQSGENSKVFHFEVVIISSHNGTTIEGNFIEPGELYPSSSQWGDKGWTCITLEDAEKRFKTTQKRVNTLAVKAEQKAEKKSKQK
jgi:hypothetical protein